MKALIGLFLLLSAACTETARTTNVIVDSDICMLTRRELLDYFSDVVDIVWEQIAPTMAQTMTEEQLALQLVAGALEACGAEPPDGGVQ